MQTIKIYIWGGLLVASVDALETLLGVFGIKHPLYQTINFAISTVWTYFAVVVIFLLHRRKLPVASPISFVGYVVISLVGSIIWAICERYAGIKFDPNWHRIPSLLFSAYYLFSLFQLNRASKPFFSNLIDTTSSSK